MLRTMNAIRGRAKLFAIIIVLLVLLYFIWRGDWGGSTISQQNSSSAFFADDYLVTDTTETKQAFASGYVKVLVAESPDSFNSTLSYAMSTKSDASVFVLFFSDIDNATGMPWCPDCRRAKPIIRKAFSLSHKNIVLVVAMIEKMAYKYHDDYPYRVDSRFMLKRIPTLALINNGAAVRQLGDKECQDYDTVYDFVVTSTSSP